MSETPRAANRLAREASPYLRQHMYNPVDWYPWGPEALETAAREQKPILLSVGYAACHWCHVMEKDAFEVESVAELMNRHFVPIKVDREERPDLDSLYQGVVQLMGRGGGWPLTVFLTPDLQPFFGGTYFPPTSGYGLPSFTRVLEALADAWANRRDEVLQSAGSFEEGLARLVRVGLGTGGAPLTGSELARAAERICQEADTRNGGFFGAPKFPHPMELSFLLRMAFAWPAELRSESVDEAKAAIRRSLDKMAEGGIHDQLGGGFHRYSVDEAWAVPHFEKMLYDNALLLRLYAEAAVAFEHSEYDRVALDIAGWMARELTDPSGGLWSSQDADSEGVEGKFFAWTPDQIEEVLGRELASLAAARFGVTATGNFEHGATVLHLAASAQEIAQERNLPVEEVEGKLAEARRRLFDSRKERVAPATDDKVIVAWNGLAIGALAAAGRLLHDDGLVEQARRAADFVLRTLATDDGLKRVYRDGNVKQEAFLDDWAALCEGLVELFETTGENRWLDEARRLGDGIVSRFWDEEQACFFLSPAGGESLRHRIPSIHDNAVPAGGSSAAVALLRLHLLTGHEQAGRVAERYLERQHDELLRSPFAFGHLLGAAFLRAKGLTEVAVLGAPGAARDALLAKARTGVHPEVVAWAAEKGESELLSGRGEVDGKPAAWICRRFTCEAPRTDPEEVTRALGLG
ncbi:thioredoxin domain-containing protein [Vulgatibacter incomptus]|uniref:Thymidylate kinase n=1 Tax=Vulgatibacter incomptus TaxID=1391653 RepID=A0A0K1PFK9_9BACT|nr:thioredoxin domain-containing protein [Vulgatibacter incomptus]AKU92318.1 Thymidylate kinase [Vulgatibacter incomptus]